MSLEGKGRKHEKLNPNWVALMEVLRGLEITALRKSCPAGRSFRQICYGHHGDGCATGFEFGKGSYGPFSEDVKIALHDFANRNWLAGGEPWADDCTATHATIRIRPKQIRHLIEGSWRERKTDKAIDLFSRIKSTEQAEEVMTVLYASRQPSAHAADEIGEFCFGGFVLCVAQCNHPPKVLSCSSCDSRSREVQSSRLRERTIAAFATTQSRWHTPSP